MNSWSAWYDFRSTCPALDCNNPNKDLYWVHRLCEEHEKINAYGMIQCLKDIRGYSCLSPTFILELSFKCGYGGHTDYRKVDGDKVLAAILIAMKVTTLPKKIRTQLVDKLNHYDDSD
jgi:hypothetical protein